MTVISLLTLVIGVLLGAVIGFLVARNREAGAAADLAARASAADERARAAEQRTALVDGQLAERFQALSAQALDASARQFLEMAEGRFSAANARAAGELETRKAAVEGLVGPLKETLTRVEAQLRESDAQRAASHAALTEQMTITRRSSDDLNRQTQALVTALRRPEARGRWGEMQLRRVVELAGMSARCDFDEQATLASSAGQQRPDMVIHLAGGKNIVVDSKVSLAAYLEAAEATDETVRETRLTAHARQLREHVDRLAAKAYWSALPTAPEFVVLFIPGEAFLAPALEHDPGLLEHAVARRVHIATPTTLVSLLRTAQYAWQQEATLGERPGGVRRRAGALRPDLRPRAAREPGGQGAHRRGGRLQPDRRLPGEPGTGERPPPRPARPRRGQPGGTADRGGDHQIAVRPRTDRPGRPRARHARADHGGRRRTEPSRNGRSGRPQGCR